MGEESIQSKLHKHSFKFIDRCSMHVSQNVSYNDKAIEPEVEDEKYVLDGWLYDSGESFDFNKA